MQTSDIDVKCGHLMLTSDVEPYVLLQEEEDKEEEEEEEENEEEEEEEDYFRNS